MVDRRKVLGGLSSLAGAVGLSGCTQRVPPILGGRASGGAPGLDPNPHDLPRRQFAHDGFVRTDAAGNALQPRFHRVLLLELSAEPSPEAARTVERAMRTLEAAYDWRHDGLFHLLAWGTDYFERLGNLGASPIERPRVLSQVDEPDLLGFDAALVLESDVESHLTAADAAMFGGRDTLGGQAVEDRLGDVFEVVRTRTGFIGEGLPAAHAGAEGVPEAIPETAPMFTGFFSGRAGTQASEDRIARTGRFEDGTTMHLSHLTLDLDRWWNGLDDAGRVARMFAPTFTPEDVAEFDTTVPFLGDLPSHAATYDVVGHHEKVARVREDGEPLIRRRDFNTVDGGQPGVHFLALQRTLAQFRKTRKAMNGWFLRDDSPAVGDETNNGILDVLTVESRANFYVPPRDARAFPLYDGG